MKKFLMLVALTALLTVPALSFAGTAYIPYYAIATTGPEFIQPSITVSNIGSSTTKVTITLYNANGTPLVNQPYLYRVASDVIGGSSTTNAKGEATFSLPPKAIGGISLYPVYLGDVTHDGFGKITGSVNGSLIAYAELADSDQNNPAFVYQRTITINGGNPF